MTTQRVEGRDTWHPLCLLVWRRPVLPVMVGWRPAAHGDDPQTANAYRAATQGVIDPGRYSALVAAVIASAVVATLIANAW